MACPTYSGMEYSLKDWARAYFAQDYENKDAFMVDNSDGPMHGGNLHYLHLIRGQNIPAVWQQTRFPSLWDTLELSWLIMVEHAHEVGADFIFSVEADVIVPAYAMQMMVDCAFAHATTDTVDGQEVVRPAVVTQRYHPRGQAGPNFWWATLGCSLFPVAPLYKARLNVCAIYEVEVFEICKKAGYPHYRPGSDGKDLFVPDHLRDPEDPYVHVFGGTPAATKYLKRVLAANEVGEEKSPLIKGSSASLAKKNLTDGKPVNLDAIPFAEKPTISIGKAHLDPEPPPPGTNADRPYKGRREADDISLEKAFPFDRVMPDPEMIGKVLLQDRIRLNIGSDVGQIAGFVSVDFNPDVKPDICTDAKDLSMFDEKTVDEIYASHVLEHLKFDDGLIALKEWLRVLKPGGVLTIAVPDLVQTYYLMKHGAAWGEYHMPIDETYVQACVFGANLLAEKLPEMRDLYGGPGHKHQSVYIHDMLLNRVIEAGFVMAHEVGRCFLRASAIGETMVQAQKPILEGE